MKAFSYSKIRLFVSSPLKLQILCHKKKCTSSRTFKTFKDDTFFWDHFSRGGGGGYIFLLWKHLRDYIQIYNIITNLQNMKKYQLSLTCLMKSSPLDSLTKWQSGYHRACYYMFILKHIISSQNIKKIYT